MKQVKRGKSANLVVSTLLVSVLALASALLLLFALVIWFAEVTGSLLLSLTIVGVVLAIAAWATYKVALSPTLKHLREEYEHTMTIVSLIRQGYECATKRIASLIKILQ